jgi:hypothetical protein
LDDWPIFTRVDMLASTASVTSNMAASTDGVLLDQDQQALDARQRGGRAHRHHGAVLGDVRAGDRDVLALGRGAGAQRLDEVGQVLASNAAVL